MWATSCGCRTVTVAFSLTDEQRLIAATMRDFVERQLYPHENEVERLDEDSGSGTCCLRSVANGTTASR
jgi:alkylation response protein AidB-like acyl-CoA dehydrogenase